MEILPDRGNSENAMKIRTKLKAGGYVGTKQPAPAKGIAEGWEYYPNT